MKPSLHHHHHPSDKVKKPPPSSSSSSSPSSLYYLLFLKRPQSLLASLAASLLFLAVFAAVARRRLSTAQQQQQQQFLYYKFPFCECERRMDASEAGGAEELRRRLLRTPSACNDYATFRGSGQRVISYSLYGDSQDREVERKYFSQVGARAKEARSKYPGWTVRVYYHNSADDFEGLRGLCSLFCSHPNVDLCDVEALPEPFGDLRGAQRIGRTWRFATMLDPLVDVFISRDLDSAILDREVAAVGEWLRSNRTFHIMRDHPSHNGYLMAGLWGARNSNDRRLLAELGGEIVEAPPRDYWDYDQALLRRLVWPHARKDSLQHDSYSCRFPAFFWPRDNNTSKAPGGQMKPVAFPTRREKGLYVGWGPARGAPDRTGIKECPRECRRREDWKFC